MRQGKLLSLRLHGKLCSKLRIHVRPGIGFLPAEKRTFRDKQVGIDGEYLGVSAVTGVGAIAYNPAIDFQPVTETPGRMHKGQSLKFKRTVMPAFRNIGYMTGIRQSIDRQRILRGEKFPEG